MDGWSTSFLLGWPIFRGYISFRECTRYIFDAFGLCDTYLLFTAKAFGLFVAWNFRTVNQFIGTFPLSRQIMEKNRISNDWWDIYSQRQQKTCTRSPCPALHDSYISESSFPQKKSTMAYYGWYDIEYQPPVFSFQKSLKISGFLGHLPHECSVPPYCPQSCAELSSQTPGDGAAIAHGILWYDSFRPCAESIFKGCLYHRWGPTKHPLLLLAGGMCFFLCVFFGWGWVRFLRIGLQQ